MRRVATALETKSSIVLGALWLQEVSTDSVNTMADHAATKASEGMRVNRITRPRTNPEALANGQWFKLPKYPADVIVCPLCRLPETEGVYRYECDCWDNRDEQRKEASK